MNKLYYEMFRSYKTVDMEMFCTFLYIGPDFIIIW